MSSDEYSVPGDYANLTKPIVTTWRGLLDRAKEAKKRFTERGAQIMTFYSGSPEAMWTPQYMNRFMGGGAAMASPKFKITANLTSEQVNIMGPLLFWEMPDIKVSPTKVLELDPMMLAGQDPAAQEYFQQLATQQSEIDAKAKMRSVVAQHALNYFQREQPSGLSAHTSLAVFDMITKGAGFLRTEEFRYPVSDQTLIGSFHQDVDDVLVDPNCKDPLWETAQWIAIRHRTTSAETEKHFNLPPGSMRNKGVSSTPTAGVISPLDPGRTGDATKDLIEWWEIFSRAGFGGDLVAETQANAIAPEFEAAKQPFFVRDKIVKNSYVYLCICTACDYPLNLPAKAMLSEMATPEWVDNQTKWPTEYWRDNKWPVQMLYAQPHSGSSAWPEPILASALGELTCLNILMSAYIQKCWDSRQTLMFHKKGAIDNLQSLLNSDVCPLGIPIDPHTTDTIKDVLSIVERPDMNDSLLQGIQFLIGQIEKRTGLVPEQYGLNSGAVDRSAAAYQGRADSINIRPDFLRKKVAEFMSNVADKTFWCAYTHVGSDSLRDVLGPLGCAAWEMLVTEEDPNVILRSSKAIVEASGMRRPNKQKDAADIKELQQYYLPILAGQMAQSGDVGPVNGFIQAFGDAAEIDVKGFMLPTPQPDEAAEQMKQIEMARAQAEVEQMQAETQKTMSDAQSSDAKNQSLMMAAQIKAQSAEHGMMLKQQTAEQAALLREHQNQLAMIAKQQDMQLKGETHVNQLERNMMDARQKSETQMMSSQQLLHQNAATHIQKTAIMDAEAADNAKRQNMITMNKMLLQRVEANNKPTGTSA